MSDKEQIERKEATERRVYNLPTDLLERLRAYQASQGIVSEIEAVRRLLHNGLQMRETVQDILATLEAKYADEKDLRVLAGEVLSKHILVEKIAFEKGAIVFHMENGTRGRMESGGNLYFAEANDRDDDWSSYPRVVYQPRAKSSPSWDAGKGDLDDEIPF